MADLHSFANFAYGVGRCGLQMGVKRVGDNYAIFFLLLAYNGIGYA